MITQDFQFLVWWGLLGGGGGVKHKLEFDICCDFILKYYLFPVVDPGFPIGGGAKPLGGTNL